MNINTNNEMNVKDVEKTKAEERKEYMRNYMRNYTQKNADSIKAYRRKWRQDHLDHIKEDRKKRYELQKQINEKFKQTFS